MLPRFRYIWLLFPTFGLSLGCQSMTQTDRGVVGGGVLGGVTGALVGSATGNTAAGAAIGAAAGGLAGGLVGHSIEESENRTKAAIATTQGPTSGPLGLTDIAQMAQQGISDAVIIGQIRSTRSVYSLSPNDLQWLKQNNVSDSVVLEMQSTSTRVPPPGPRVYGRPYQGPDVIFVEPYAPPPPIGLGFSYTRVRRY